MNRKNPQLPQGLFNCNNKNCKLCALYIKPCASFKTLNNVIWDIRSHITCQSKNVICFLKCTSYNYSTTYINKTVDLRSHMNNHITICRLGGSMDKFDKHIFYCMQNQKQELFFQILMLTKLGNEQNLLFYENYFKTEVMILSINHN